MSGADQQIIVPVGIYVARRGNGGAQPAGAFGSEYGEVGTVPESGRRAEPDEDRALVGFEAGIVTVVLVPDNEVVVPIAVEVTRGNRWHASRSFRDENSPGRRDIPNGGTVVVTRAESIEVGVVRVVAITRVADIADPVTIFVFLIRVEVKAAVVRNRAASVQIVIVLFPIARIASGAVARLVFMKSAAAAGVRLARSIERRLRARPGWRCCSHSVPGR